MTFEIKPPETSTFMLYYPYFANDLGFLLNFGIYLGERTFFFVFHFFFSSFYCADFFISFVLRHLWVKQFFTLRVSRILRIVQEKCVSSCNLELRAPEMRAAPGVTIQEQTRIKV